jgi:hypothetical protein
LLQTEQIKKQRGKGLMNEYAELEISLHRHDANSYAVDFRYNQPESDADIRLSQGRLSLAEFDFNKLRSLALDPAAYGQALAACLFADSTVQTAFGQARASAGSLNIPLRLRLLVGPTASELHALRWETLRDPGDNSPLFTGENLLFSRYLSSLDWRPVRLRPAGELSALVVIANPSDLDDYDMAAIDRDAELGRAKTGFGSISVTALPESDKAPRATLNNLLSCLRDAGFDILYLVCHGALIKDEPWLWLEDEQGKVVRTAGSELVQGMKDLSPQQRPRLVVLASCESAKAGAEDALAGLGPLLAEAGVPAVLAMQGKISQETNGSFMGTFFKELIRDGQIDRSMAVARREVRARPDYWMPALFMRLKSGRIWYVPGFGEESKGFQKWPALISSISNGKCTPILGPGMVEALLGSLREIAQRWAETYHYPMAPHERESLPQVAQYLTVNQAPGFPFDQLEKYLKKELRDRYSGDLPENLRQGQATLDQLVQEVGAKWRVRAPMEPHKVLAQLPLPIFINTNKDNLLVTALQEAKKDPQVLICPWNDYGEQAETIYDKEPDYQPTPERPLVYHLFGRFSEPDSVVLTEDDYFKFLIGVTRQNDLIPPVVRRALTDTALLFLGFQLDEWNFRVLFQSILSRPSGRRARYAHIAAQIEPEEGRILEPERARQYLETYFSLGADISIYWGSAEDFVKELMQQWSKSSDN